MLIKNSRSIAAVGFAALAAAGSAAAAMVVENGIIDDYAMPLVIGDFGPTDYSFPGVFLRNPTAQETDFRLTLPVSFFDIDGNVLSSAESAGSLLIRAMPAPGTRFDYTALTGAAAAGEKDLLVNLPPVEQSSIGFGGSLNYGMATFSLTGLAVQPGASTFVALQFVPRNGTSTIFFLNDGMDPGTGHLRTGVESTWLASNLYNGDLLDTDDFGPNRVLAMTVETIPVLARLVGDLNLDGIVDGIDLSVLGAHWQSAGGPSDGDLNSDGWVDGIDLSLLGANWQATAAGLLNVGFGEAASAMGISVPEPASMTAAIIGVAVLGLRRRP